MTSLLLFVAILQVGSSDSPASEKVLVPSTARTTTVPMFSFVGHGQCDAHQNLYFLIPPETDASSSPFVMRLGANDIPTLYRASYKDKEPIENALFYMNRANDRVSLLLQTDLGLKLFSFNGNGKQTSAEALDVPAGLVAQTFAVTQVGTVFVSGFFNGRAPVDLRSKTFAAVFDGATGKAIRSIDSLSGSKLDPKKLSKPSDMAAATSKDDDFYVAYNGRLVVVSASGIQKQDLPIPRMTAGGVVAALEPDKSKVTLQFMVPRSPGFTTLLEVVDLESGKVVETESPDASMGSNLVCSWNGYTFLRPENGKVKLISSVTR
jgi:hypothetical protein